MYFLHGLCVIRLFFALSNGSQAPRNSPNIKPNEERKKMRNGKRRSREWREKNVPQPKLQI